MRKTIKTEQDGFKAYQRIKALADHHAHTINQVIDHLYVAIKQYKDTDSTIIYTGNTIEFKAKGIIFSMSYVIDKITFSTRENKDHIIAYFDNSLDRETVMEFFRNLK